MANFFENATSFGVPQPDGTTKGYTFSNSPSGSTFGGASPSLPGASIGQGDWFNDRFAGDTAVTPGGAPNPVAAAAGFNQPSPGAVGVPAGSGGGTQNAIQNWFVRGGVFLLGLIFVGGGVAMFGR